MTDWSPGQYLKFADERTRAARDLLAQVPLTEARRVYDLGCGPGNSTALLVQRFPDADVTGVDSSEGMLAAARKALPECKFVPGDLASWSPKETPDLLFANAVFQWVPDHAGVLKHLLGTLGEGGVLAVQMPDNLGEPSHRLMRDTAGDGPWDTKLAAAARARNVMPPLSAYYDLLKPIAARVDIWHTYYNHPLDGAQGIIEWLKATGLRPFLDPLDADEQAAFLAAYKARIAEAYPPRCDGTSLLRFPRLFIVAVR
ncbi:trans-aconitate 2-methyltransferase [soil metagenome]